MNVALLFIQSDLLRVPLHITETLRVLLPPNRPSEVSDCWWNQQIYGMNNLRTKYSQQTLKILFDVFEFLAPPGKARLKLMLYSGFNFFTFHEFCGSSW